MKKLLLSAIALSVVSIVSVMQAEGPVRYDSQGRPYRHKGQGPVFGTMNKVFTGSNRDYLDQNQPLPEEPSKHRGSRNHRNRGVVGGTVDATADIARGTGHAIGHGLKNVFGGGNHHHGFYDSEGIYHE